jgi:hypothetical protein
LSTASTFTEFKSFDSDALGKVKLLSGPHTKGQPFEVHLVFTYGVDRTVLDTLKSFCGLQISLDTAKFNEDRTNPAQITLTMKDDVRTTAKAKATAEKCVQRLIDLKDRQHRCTPAVAVHSNTSRWEQHTQ